MCTWTSKVSFAGLYRKSPKVMYNNCRRSSSSWLLQTITRYIREIRCQRSSHRMGGFVAHLAKVTIYFPPGHVSSHWNSLFSFSWKCLLESWRHRYSWIVWSPYHCSIVKIHILSANRVNLTVIPLVQTFGHAEWILKTALFEPLRENENYTNVCFISIFYFSSPSFEWVSIQNVRCSALAIQQRRTFSPISFPRLEVYRNHTFNSISSSGGSIACSSHSNAILPHWSGRSSNQGEIMNWIDGFIKKPQPGTCPEDIEMMEELGTNDTKVLVFHHLRTVSKLIQDEFPETKVRFRIPTSIWISIP